MSATAPSNDAKKKRFRLFLWLLLVPVILIVWLAADVRYFLTTPADSEPREVTIEVSSGMSLPALSKLLKERGLITSPARFSWLVRFKGAARQIKAGEYQLSTGLRPGELLEKIVRGEVRLH